MCQQNAWQKGEIVFAGSMVALVTPFLEDGSIDFPAWENLISWQLACGTDALIVLGTTGESATVAEDERDQLIQAAIAKVAGQAPVIVGTGSNNTKQSIERSLRAKELGADACLLVTPYYNKPGQSGMQQHFSAIAQAVDLPIILYNVPSRTNCDLSVATTINLAKKHNNIIGLKDATADFSRIPVLLSETELVLFSGDDATAMDFMRCGGHGVISVVGNVLPNQVAAMCDAVLTGDYAEAVRINQETLLWQRNMFIDTNPVPAKFVLQELGVINSDAVRLPLVELPDENKNKLLTDIKVSKILKRR